MAQSVTESPHRLNFLLAEAPGSLSREQVTIEANQDIKPGHVLGKVTGSSISASADGDNTGDGTMGSLAVNTGSKPGDYRVVITEPATDAGTFNVFDPDGVFIDSGTVGSAFSGGGIDFTLSDGATDFAAGDAFSVTVSGTGEYKEYDPTSTDGSDRAEAVAIDHVDTTDGSTAPAAVIARMAEVNAAELAWFSNATSAEQTTGQDQLAEHNIIAR